MRLINHEKTVAAEIENNLVSRLLKAPSKMGRITQGLESKFGIMVCRKMCYFLSFCLDLRKIFKFLSKKSKVGCFKNEFVDMFNKKNKG